MMLLGHLAKVQGLKGEFLLHELMDQPEKLTHLPDLILAPPHLNLEQVENAPEGARSVTVRSFRWHQERPCVAFTEIPDRTAAESFKDWTLWMPEALAVLEEGETFRHDWIGCEIFLAGVKVGEVVRLEPTAMGYDMVYMRDLRPRRTGLREIPYIKAWFTLDLPRKRIDLDPPEGLLDLDRLD